MCAVRGSRSSEETARFPLARWVGRPRPTVTANDNRAPVTVLGPVVLLVALRWRVTWGVCGFGMLAACACLLAVTSPQY